MVEEVGVLDGLRRNERWVWKRFVVVGSEKEERKREQRYDFEREKWPEEEPKNKEEKKKKLRAKP